MRYFTNVLLILSLLFSTAVGAQTQPRDPIGRESTGPTTYKEQATTPATPAAGKRKIYPKSDGFYQVDSTGAESKIGTGSGGINYLSANSDFESKLTPWEKYSNVIQLLAGASGSDVTTNRLIYNRTGQSFIVEGTPVVVTASAGSAPTPIFPATTYYVRNVVNGVTNSDFQLSATPTGTIVDITVVGTGTGEVRPIIPISLQTTSLVTGAITAKRGTFAVDSITPPRGLGALLMSKSSNNSAGEGVRIPYKVDVADQGKQLTLYLDTAFVDTLNQYADGDYTVFVWDASNNVIINGSGTPITKHLLASQTIGIPVPSIVGVSDYYLIIHYKGNVTGPFQFIADNATLNAASVNFGLYGSDLKSYGTITIGATTTPPTKGTTSTDVIRARQVGDHWHIKGEYRHTSAGGAGSGDYLFTLPNNLQFDPNKVSYFTTLIGASSAYLTQIGIGSATISNGANTGVGTIIPYDATRFRLALINIAPTNANGGTGALGSGFFGLNFTNLSFSFDFYAPISGTSSNMVLSSQVSGRPIEFSTTVANATIPTSGGASMVAEIDTVGGWNGTRYTIKEPGNYVAFLVGSPSTTVGASLFRNNVFYRGLGGTTSGLGLAGMVSMPGLIAGDYLEVRSTGAAYTLTGAHFSIFKLNTGFQTVAFDNLFSSTANSTGRGFFLSFGGAGSYASPTNCQVTTCVVYKGPAGVTVTSNGNATYTVNVPTGTFNEPFFCVMGMLWTQSGSIAVMDAASTRASNLTNTAWSFRTLRSTNYTLEYSYGDLWCGVSR